MADTKMREASAKITYNGKDITTTLQNRTGSFSYTDPDCGESDSCSFSIFDPDDSWLDSMFPKLGDTMKAKISVKDWKKQGDDRSLNCGTFLIDAPIFSGPPTSVSIKGVSKPSDLSFSTQKRTQTWENVTIEEIAKEFAKKYELKLKYDADTVKIEALEQSDETDSNFLNKTCENYGLSLKIYNKKLIVYDRERYKKKAADITIKKAEMSDFSYEPSLLHTYTGGKMSFKDAKTGNDITVQVGTKKRLLSVNAKADSVADAEKQICSALNKANEEQETLTIIIPGNPDLCSTMVVKIKGLGVADGKYFIKQATHSIGDKYETKLDLFKVQKAFEYESVKDDSIVTVTKEAEAVMTETVEVQNITPTSDKSWIWPLGSYPVYISSGYGNRDPSISGWDFHGGIDITGAGINGQPIYAAKGGTVTTATNGTTGYGRYVVIDHGDGFTSIYGHCSSLAVTVGQKVSQGQVISYVGSTGNSTGPHLHFEIRQNGHRVNPASYVSKP